jgi:hypothetical protein
VRLVSDQSELEMRCRKVREGLTWPLRELAATAVRIDGQPMFEHSLPREMVGLCKGVTL